MKNKITIKVDELNRLLLYILDKVEPCYKKEVKLIIEDLFEEQSTELPL